jgi:hypothetical protein
MSEENDDGEDRELVLEPGPRVTGSEEILRIERELTEKRELDNPAIPAHLLDGRETVQEWRELIEEETHRDNPRRHVIAYANARIALK